MTAVPTHTTPTATATPTPARGWAVLLLAGAFEVGYALSVAGSHGFTNVTMSLVAAVFFLLTLSCLSQALRAIDVGLGYAVWAGIGAVGVAILGPVFFEETFTLTRGSWLAVIIVGVVWLKLADRPAPRPQPRRRRRSRSGGDAHTLTGGGEVHWY